MHEWSESIWIAVNLLIGSVVLTFILGLSSIGREFIIAVNDDRRMAEQVQEYRKYNQYDNKEVYCQDIVSLIFETRGDPYVKVVTDSGSVLEWSKDAQSTPYTSAAVTAAIPIDNTYQASVLKDFNGAVVGYKFIAS